MKKYLTLFAIATSCFCMAQQLPQSLSVAVHSSKVGEDILKPTITPTLSYYSKNYTDVFGRYNYTLDPLKYGDRNIYVETDTKQYNNLNNKFLTYMPTAGVDVNNGFYSYNYADFTAAVLALWGADNINLVHTFR